MPALCQGLDVKDVTANKSAMVHTLIHKAQEYSYFTVY